MVSENQGLPYRLGVGMVVVNKEGLVFIGHRIDSGIAPKGGWQMPQGGLSPGEDPYTAALRELYEETHISSVTLLSQSSSWYTYDIPNPLRKTLWQGRYRGQKQKWFAFRFTGMDSEIDLGFQNTQQPKPEFNAWRWENIHALPPLIVPFKRALYEQIATDFAAYTHPVA